MFAPRSSSPVLKRKPAVPRAAKKSTSNRKPSPARVTVTGRAATTELYRLLERKEAEALKLKDQVEQLRGRSEYLEAQHIRGATLVRDSKSNLHIASKERDMLRDRLDNVVLTMEEQDPSSLLNALDEGTTSVEEIEAAKLRRGVQLRQEIIETLQLTLAEMDQQLENANQLGTETEQENKLLLEENKELNEQLGRQADDADRVASTLRNEQLRAERAETMCEQTMEQLKYLQNEQRLLCEQTASNNLNRMEAENNARMLAAQLEVYHRAYPVVNLTPQQMTPAPMTPQQIPPPPPPTVNQVHASLPPEEAQPHGTPRQHSWHQSTASVPQQQQHSWHQSTASVPSQTQTDQELESEIRHQLQVQPSPTVAVDAEQVQGLFGLLQQKDNGIDKLSKEMQESSGELRELRSRVAAHEAEIVRLRRDASEAAHAEARRSEAEEQLSEKEWELNQLRDSHSELKRRHLLVNRYLQV